jgi:acetyl esterase/lipase
MLSLPTSVVKAFVRRKLHFAKYNGRAPRTYRAAMERFALPAPMGIRRRPVGGDVRGEWLLPKRPHADECILYVHGGAYCFGSVKTHREFAGRLARLSGRKVFLLEYRLAPEHPFPAAHDDALRAFQWLAEQGFAPQKITVIGDSAGGNLALSLALGLRELGLEQPRALVLLSPWTDLRCGPVDPDLERRDPMIDLTFGRNAAADYCGAEDPKHPLISPLFADLSGLPPMLIHVGSEEILLRDSQALAAKARGDGVEIDLQVWDGMFHVWHLFGIVLAESRRAHADIVRFINREFARPAMVTTK